MNSNESPLYNQAKRRRLTKQEYREKLKERLNDPNHSKEFKVKKITLSNNDPVLQIIKSMQDKISHSQCSCLFFCKCHK